MTAIVGVLNKQGIAVAADSAETIGGGIKIYDKANKIFTLSKHHPIGIAVYNNASFNSCIPWEIIVKMYRRQLDNRSFNTIQEYLNDFFQYLEDYQATYMTVGDFESITCSEVNCFWLTEVIRNLPHCKAGKADIDPEDISALEELLISYKEKALTTPKIPELADIEYDSFKACINNRFLNPIIKQIVKIGGDKQKFTTIIPEALFEVFTRQCLNRPMYSGMAFFGYGEKEIYPSLLEVLVFHSFVGKLYWTVKSFEQVQNQPPTAFIHPMAQTDVMSTYIEGISPYIEGTFMQITKETMERFLLDVQKAVKKDPVLEGNIKAIDLTPFMDHFKERINRHKLETTIGPLMDTIATMEKEDLAELAENLIYLTSLQRRITPNLESVGGPVDVVIVSKGDGFIWIKRKHYFDPQLNRVYFDKYFKS